MHRKITIMIQSDRPRCHPRQRTATATTGKKAMPKLMPETLTALFLASTLGACAWLPPTSNEDSTASLEAADTAYVDYWQTRDPSDYRQRAAGAANSQPVTPSQDVVVARQPTPSAKVKKNPEPRIVTVIPVQGNNTTPPAKAGTPGKTEAVAIATASPATPIKKAKRTAASARQKSKGKAPIASKDLWGRMRGRLALAEIEHPRITERIDALKRNPGYLNLFVQRARPYLHYIVEHIDRSRLPMDLALVPMVESGFEPTAISPKAAAGLWQIIPTTGQERGLIAGRGL